MKVLAKRKIGGSVDGNYDKGTHEYFSLPFSLLRLARPPAVIKTSGTCGGDCCTKGGELRGHHRWVALGADEP